MTFQSEAEIRLGTLSQENVRAKPKVKTFINVPENAKTDKPNSKSTKRDKKPAILCVKPQELVSTLVTNPRSLFNPFLISKSLEVVQ